MPAQTATSFRLTAADIDDAFLRDEFTVVFQPKVDLASGAVTGAEAFVRWAHPRLGLLPPGLFLQAIEQEKRAADLTYFVMAKSIQAAAHWRHAGRRWSVSINVSPSDLLDDEFCGHLIELARANNVPPQAIVIEAPERALAEDAEAILATLDDLRAAGFHVALDGGGVVPVDLNKYQPVPFTSIKVGGQAMLRLAERLGMNGAGAISARLRFARDHGLETVAVGAESEETIARLKACGFTAVQGIWIQRPLRFDALMAWNGAWMRETAMPIHASPVAAPPSPVIQAPPEPEPAAAMSPPEKKTRRSRLSADTLAKLTSPSQPLLDVVEEFEAPPARGHNAAAASEACLPMSHLVQRRKKPALDAPVCPPPRKSTILDPIFGV